MTHRTRGKKQKKKKQ